MNVTHFSCLGSALVAVLTAAAGCASVPRPVPLGDQLVTTRETAEARLSVPRLEYNAYPDDVLDAATAVYVVIENKGATDLSIAREDFSFGLAGGLRQTPLVPRQVLVTSEPAGGGPVPTASIAPPPRPADPGEVKLVLLAGPVQQVSGKTPMSALAVNQAAGPPRASGGSPVYVPPPRSPAPGPSVPLGRGPGPWLGGSLGYYPGSPYWGGPGWWGPGWWGPGAYGWGLGWGYPYWGGGFYSYPRPRQSIIRMALQTGTLARGGRTAGFLYFPRTADVRQGMAAELRWEVHDAPGRQVRGELVVPLEFDSER